MSETAPGLPVDRWLITATIRVTAPLAIHTGHDEPNDGGDGSLQAIELDHKQAPFVPGTAIKGLLRHLAASHIGASDDLVERLLGGLAKDRGSATRAQTARAGSAEIRNAWSIGDVLPELPVRGQTAIDRGSRTASDAMLRHGTAVPPDTCFGLEIVVDRGGSDEVELLLGLLGLAEAAEQDMGSRGGRIQLESIKVQHLDAAGIVRWLGNGGSWIDAATAATGLQPAKLIPRGNAVHFALGLQIGGYFLVGVDQGKPPEGGPNVKPYSSRRGEARPELPASSFDGALRAQAERIWMTVHGLSLSDWSKEPPPGPLEELFGSRNRKGLFTPHDFLGSADTPLVLVNATAIDRISAAVNHTGPVTTQAFEAPLLKGGFTLTFLRRVNWEASGQRPHGAGDSREIGAAAIGLLALTLRDLGESDIAFGRGTRNGYGDVVRLQYGQDGSLADLLVAIAQAWQPDAADPQAVIRQAVCAFRTWTPDQQAAINPKEAVA